MRIPGLSTAFLLVHLLPCILAESAGGAVWRVDPWQGGGAMTIQEAVDAAAPGDTILLGPGTYSEHLWLSDKGLTFKGAEGAAATILDAGSSGRILTIDRGGMLVRLEGLTFQHGFVAGIEFGNQGGAVAAYETPLVIDSCVFRENYALTQGGGVYATRHPHPQRGASPSPFPSGDSQLLITSSTFVGNWQPEEGGAVAVEEMPSVIRDSRFENNSGVGGGAIGFLRSDHLVQGCVFTGNRARINGGALQYVGFGTLTVQECEFRGNQAPSRGGAIWTVNGTLILTRAWFLENAAGRGGGVATLRTALNASYTLWYRASASDRGGGLFIEDSPTVFLTRCSWLDNSAPQGSSLTLWQTPEITLQSSLLGDEAYRPVDCTISTVTHTSCLLGTSDQGICMSLDGTESIEICDSFPQGACTLPQFPGCGVVGHAEETCPPGTCASPAVPSSWGRLKIRYR